MAQDPVEDMQRVLLRVAEAAAAATVESFVTRWATWGQDILAAAALPPWDAFVRIHADGHWVQDLPPDWHTRADDLLRPGEEIGSVGVLIDRLYGRESTERYAYDILERLSHLHRARTAQDMEGALRALHRLHTLVAIATIKLAWEADARFGRRIRARARLGGQQRARDRQATHQQLRVAQHQAAERLRHEHPTWSKLAVARRVHEQVGGSIHTIRKFVPPPRQQRPLT